MNLPSSVPHQWVVDCRKVGYGLPALKYLSRYLYRGVLPDKDIIKISDKDVTFRYQYTNQGQTFMPPATSMIWHALGSPSLHDPFIAINFRFDNARTH
ncbi:hypothetical protein VIRA109638_12585 [Vibrio rarus]